MRNLKTRLAILAGGLLILAAALAALADYQWPL
jgi:hypothetical protein